MQFDSVSNNDIRRIKLKSEDEGILINGNSVHDLRDKLIKKDILFDSASPFAHDIGRKREERGKWSGKNISPKLLERTFLYLPDSLSRNFKVFPNLFERCSTAMVEVVSAFNDETFLG
jgi:hypothetical protein